MKNIVITSLLLVHCIVVAGQSHITWLQNNTTEFTDFSFIDKAVEDKRFVFLGESSHGANEFFLFKTELTKYLIEKHDFEVVAFESPFVASYFYNNLPETRTDSLSHVEHVLFPIFCNPITQAFINTLDEWNIPIVGFDNQLGTVYQARNVTHFVYDKLVKIDSITAKEYLEINPLFSKDNIVRFSKNEVWHNYPCIAINDQMTCEYWLKKYSHFLKVLTSNYDQLLKLCNNNSLMAFATIRAVQTVHIDLASTIVKDHFYLRDSLMAKNIEHFIQHVFPTKKIVFLAHNVHIAKQYNIVKGGVMDSGETNRSMAGFLKKEVIDSSLIIGLYGIDGETNNNKRTPVKMIAAEQDSTLQFQLKEVIDRQAYIDLNGYPNLDDNGNVYLSRWGIYPEKFNPHDQYDYLVFIKNLTPSTYLDNKKTRLPTKNKAH